MALFPTGWAVRLRQIAPVALVLGVTIAGFFGARLLGERDARRDSERRAEVAAAQIRAHVEDGTSLLESLRRYMASGTSVTSGDFASNASRWLSPEGFGAAAWVERVPASRRAAYERQIGQPIVTRDRRLRTVPVGSRSSYLPMTLVSGISPMASPGIDLGSEPGLAAALDRARVDVRATPLTTLRDGTRGVLLIRFAPRASGGVVKPGFVVLFTPAADLRAAATDSGPLRLAVGGNSAGDLRGGAVARRTFSAAGQRFDVALPERSINGPAAVLPWIILAAGLVLAALAAALGVNASRRARATAEVDRLFTLSPDLIVVAGFDGFWKRVNPAFETRLGYTESEALARPYLDFVHPDDRDRSEAEAARALGLDTILVFENRMVCKDGSHRWVEWTATPVPEERVLYGVGRDVTDRRQAETEVERLADEQAALRRVATLVAREAPQAEIFTAIAQEIGQLLGAEEIRMLRYNEDRSSLVVASWGEAEDVFPLGSRGRFGGGDAATRVYRTKQPVRIDDYGQAGGPVAEAVRSIGIRGVVAAPVLVEARLWGAMVTATSDDEPLPSETESRLVQFTELMATAIANTESHARADRLAEDQAALRRVATLVAKESRPVEVFAKVVEEVSHAHGGADCALLRNEGDGAAESLAVWGTGMTAAFPVGIRMPLDGDGVTATVLREGRTRRIDDYSVATGTIAEHGHEHGIRSAVGCPVLVHGRVWGVIGVARFEGEPLPPETESRLAQFSDLVATTIANAEARAEVERLGDEQAALRRVATLVAEGASADILFDAVAAEMERLLDADQVVLSRYEPGAEVTVVAHRGPSARRVPVGSRVSHDGESVQAIVQRTGRSARIENFERAHGTIAQLARTVGARVVVGAPIVVNGGLWGVISASWNHEEPPPADTEERMAQFAELLDTAIANAESRAELMASRTRVVAASDEARRRFERDLHDGVQQRLVSLALELQVADGMAPPDNEELVAQLAKVGEGLMEVFDVLRELARGIHPAVLSQGGLAPALRALARRSPVPTTLDLAVDERLGDHIEVGAYYVVSEALTNAAKHAQASKVEVSAQARNGVLELTIADNGVGGADPARGSGLTGLADRVAALGGKIAIESPPDRGTSVRVELPVIGGTAQPI
jgi:PAS domain S-box-containing protein